MTIHSAIDITVQERLTNRVDKGWWEARPDFYRVALELSYLDGLTGEGWWADWWGCMYAENAMRYFGGFVAAAALACEEDHEGSSATTTVSLIECMDGYLDWEAVVGSSDDDDEAGKLIETARAALDALRLHLLAQAEPAAQH